MIVVFKSRISLQLYLVEEQGSGIMDAISKYGGQFGFKMPTVKLISAMQCHGYK
jgi:hypothetical protein